MANRVVQWLRRLYNYAGDELSYAGSNPVRISKAKHGDRSRRGGGVQLFREHSRDRFLHPDEAPRFFRALQDDPHENFRDLIWLLLLTGARRRNMQSMRWDDLNLARALWTIPKTKSGEPATIPLSHWAVSLLRQRQQRTDSSAWVFPAKSRSGHVEEPKKLWNALRQRAGVPDLTTHDLRRTQATWQKMAGGALDVIGASLGHRIGGVTGIYARIDTESIRNSIEAGTVKLLEAGGVKP